MERYLINPCSGRKIAVKKGQRTTVTDVDGGQVVDFFAEMEGNSREFLSPGVTMDCNESIRLKVGDTLYEGDTLLGTVTAVEVTPNKAVQLTADGTPKEIESKLACDIKLTFTTEQFHNDGGYSIGTAEWLAGTSHVISNGFAVSTAVVRSIEQ